MTGGKLKIAVQKSDRIANDFLSLLSACGIQTNGAMKKLYCNFVDFPLEIYFVRGGDVPVLMKEQFDVAVLGIDSFLQYQMNNDTEIVRKLGFSKCHLSFAGKNSGENWDIQQLQNATIATSYTNILQDFLDKNDIKSNIVKMSGSVETSIELGFADYIFDIVQTGSTLMQQGLTELKSVLNLEAVLIKNKDFSSEILDDLLLRIDAVLLGKQQKYLMFNIKKSLVEQVKSVLPSANSPTILNLIDSDYVAIHTLCEKNKIFEICKKLKDYGAEGIIVGDVNLMFK